ncbi:IQ domain-containing protein M [Eretmochelys imbricata]
MCPTEKLGKAYQDWRGEVSQKPLNAQKQAKQKRPIIKESDKEMAEWVGEQQDWEAVEELIVLITTDLQDDKLKKAVTIAPESKRKISSGKCIVIKTQEKVKRIGPHLEVFEAFHARKDPSCRKVIRASIYIQKYVRGWLERTRFNRIKTKAKSHGPSLLAVVKAYRKMMNRIQRRAGVLNPSTPLRYSELEEWLDKKKFYETMFAKREFWKEMDKNDLQAFFKDCGQLLPQQQIDKVLHLVCPGKCLFFFLMFSQWSGNIHYNFVMSLCRDSTGAAVIKNRLDKACSNFSSYTRNGSISSLKYCKLFPCNKGHPSEVTTIKQHQALEMAFTLYPPAGAKQSIVVPVRSTWVQPIVDGEDGYIYLVSGHPALKAADIRVTGELVASSMREWKMKNLSAQNS